MAGVQRTGMRTGRLLLALGCVSVLVLAGCGTDFEESESPEGGSTLVAAITEGDPMDWDPSVDNEKASIHFGDTLIQLEPGDRRARWARWRSRTSCPTTA